MNCKNCFKYGHTFYNCKKPIRSYGIILYKTDPTSPIHPPGLVAVSSAALPQQGTKKYLMICRKHSYGFISIIRGKYSSTNPEQIQVHIDSLTNYEKELMTTKDFGELWEYMWGGTLSNRKNHDRTHAEVKYLNVRDVVLDCIANSATHWECPEWEFPKGRMQQGETDIECAMREFEEETHISPCNINVVYNLCPFEEIYKASNDKMYQITYFLAKLKNEEPNLLSFQEEEVSCMEWKTLEGCLESIRPCNKEKKELVQSLEDILNNYAIL
jgi:ADP-ribose pyrophosphatase YjhB (NUDIX family)